MGRKKNEQPSYLLHKPSGQARVRIGGVDHYLGEYQSKESWQAYHQLLLDHGSGAPLPKRRESNPSNLLISELVERYLAHADAYYGKGASEVFRITSAVRPLLAVYGSERAVEFSPIKMKKVIEFMVRCGDARPGKNTAGKPISRNTANTYLRLLKRLFRWAASESLITSELYQAVLTVDSIKKNLGHLSKMTRERPKVKPVSAEDVEKTLKECQPEIAAMIRLQLLCGMRPDEVTILRPSSIDMKQTPCWVYRPEAHKTENHEGLEDKQILIGPKAQAILKPWIEKCQPGGYLFDPRAVCERWIKEELQDSGRKQTLVKLNKRTPPRPHYDDSTYRQAVGRACKRAKVEEWTPNQLRHSAGTIIRSLFGLEAAKLVLGHQHLKTTEVYADRDMEKYKQIMAEAG